MSVSDPTTTTTDETTTTDLAYAITEIDTELDSRDCPHECHGELSVSDDGRVLCQSCRCTPSGVYIPPSEGDSVDTIESAPSSLSTHFFYPKGPPVPTRVERDRYSHSKKVILLGGFEAVYDETHSAGEGDSYTFDLSTL